MRHVAWLLPTVWLRSQHVSVMGNRKWVAITLSLTVQQKLAKLPGHGLNSQVCDLTLTNGRVLKQTLVKSCRFFYTGKNLTTADIVDAELSF